MCVDPVLTHPAAALQNQWTSSVPKGLVGVVLKWITVLLIGRFRAVLE